MSKDDSLFSWNFVGNKNLVDFLQQNIVNDRLSHAYIFSGREHVGKKTLTQLFLKSALCHRYHRESGKVTSVIPCGSCFHCQQLDKGIHPDLIWVECGVDEKTQKRKKSISIEQVRKMQSSLETASFLNSYKFAVVEDAERLSLSASNSLLKTLEEPRKNVILILICENKESMLPTILSRCQNYLLRDVSTEDIYDDLISQNVDTDRARIFSGLASGLPGFARRLVQDPLLFSQHQEAVQMLYALCEADVATRLVRAESIVSKKKDTQSFELSDLFQKWILAMRDVLLIKSMNVTEPQIQNSWYYKNLSHVASRYTLGRVVALLRQLEASQRMLKENINQKFLLENFLLSLS